MKDQIRIPSCISHEIFESKLSKNIYSAKYVFKNATDKNLENFKKFGMKNKKKKTYLNIIREVTDYDFAHDPRRKKASKNDKFKIVF